MSRLITFSSVSSVESRHALCERLRQATDGDAGLWYEASSSGEVLNAVVSGSPAVKARVAELMGYVIPGGTAWYTPPAAIKAGRRRWQVDAVPAHMTRSFRSLHDDLALAPDFRSLPLFQVFYGPLGISDQLRLLPFHEGKSLGWIGTLRTNGDRFTTAERRAADALASELREGLIAVRDREALQSPVAYVVTAHSARIVHACAAAAAWMTADRVELLPLAIAAMARDGTDQCQIDGVMFKTVGLNGADGKHSLLTMSPCAARAARISLPLSAVELDVARIAARDKTVTDIAVELGLSVNTVKSHMKKVYRKLGVSSRLELAQKLG